MAEISHEFSARLREALQGAGLSQRDAAKIIGVTDASMTKYAKNGGVPEWHILIKIAKLLNVTCDWLLEGEGSLSVGATPQDDRSDADETGPLAVVVGQGSPVFQEAEVLGQELSAWLKRQAIRRPVQWPALVKTVENMRSTWESEQASRESPDDPAMAGPAGQVAARGDR